MSQTDNAQQESILDQIRADRDRWHRAAEILADSISLAQRGDFEGTAEILEQVYEEAIKDER